jgi:hypothetical protein
MKIKPLWLLVALLATGAAAATLYRAAYQTAAAPASMAAMLPQGALLTIESPDFAALLQQWNASPEQKSWLASDNYSVFSKSRLFGRLDDARKEFESAAKASPSSATSLNGDFLTQVAGRQSIFAWYDVGNLEFLYITRISAAQSSSLSLLKDRASWSARQAGGSTFYIRKSAATGPNASAEANDEQAASAQGKARTVAFAQIPDPGGDLLVLATREDLIANALALIHPAASAQSVATEPWYTEISAALPSVDHPPALHMVLNLDRLTRLSYFRSYWVQRNVTQMQRYRAAVTDLYPYPAGGGFGPQFREYRALLGDSADEPSDQAYLDSLAALAPPTGAWHAAAAHDPEDAIAALDEKLLGRITLPAATETEAPDPSLDAPQSGSTTDLETRIDAPAPVTEAVSNLALTQVLKAAGLDAVLTWSTASQPATPNGLWVPIHSAVALEGASAWNPRAIASALQQSLRGNLTAASLGIEFRADTVNGQTIYALTGPKPLFFAALSVTSPSTTPAQVNLCLFTDDRALLLSLLGRARQLPTTEARARPAQQVFLAGFDHTSQRAPYARLTSLVDGTNNGAQKNAQPAFFSGNLRSLSDTFAELASERFEEHRDGAIVRQSVIYQWQAP